jgi:hypothetical protein
LAPASLHQNDWKEAKYKHNYGQLVAPYGGHGAAGYALFGLAFTGVYFNTRKAEKKTYKQSFKFRRNPV